MAKYYPTCDSCGVKSEEPMDGHPMGVLICPKCVTARKDAEERQRQMQPAALLRRIEELEHRLDDLDCTHMESRVDELESDVRCLERDA